ncbi:MAG: hypothetical protein Tsb0016_05100 [Sphingomonadales bacterium]
MQQSRWQVMALALAALLVASPAAQAPAEQGAAPLGNRFQPSQKINADTIVDFPVDI